MADPYIFAASSSTFPWIKFSLLLLLTAGTSISMSPPQPRALSQNTTTKRTFFDKLVRRMTWLVKVATWIVAAIDLITTLYAVFNPKAFLPSTPSATHPNATSIHSIALPTMICPHPSSPVLIPLSFSAISHPDSLDHALTNPSPLFLLSVLSVTLGALLRKYCYVTLGRYFTFEVSILPDHNLITTGPYTWVRHPSYTGMYAALLGVLGALGSRGSWVRECGVVPPLSSSLRGWSWMAPADTIGDGVTRAGTGTEMAWALFAWCFVCMFIANIGYGLWSMAKRVGIEDEALRRRFGKEWEIYAKRVRWGMFPGVF